MTHSLFEFLEHVIFRCNLQLQLSHQRVWKCTSILHSPDFNTTWVILAPLEAIRDEDIIKSPVPFISSLFQTIQVLLEFVDYFVSTLLITFRLFHVDFMR